MAQIPNLQHPIDTKLSSQIGSGKKPKMANHRSKASVNSVPLWFIISYPET